MNNENKLRLCQAKLIKRQCLGCPQTESYGPGLFAGSRSCFSGLSPIGKIYISYLKVSVLSKVLDFECFFMTSEQWYTSVYYADLSTSKQQQPNMCLLSLILLQCAVGVQSVPTPLCAACCVLCVFTIPTISQWVTIKQCNNYLVF